MKEKILKLRESGMSYNSIASSLGCSKSTVCYYCGNHQKEKSIIRQRKNRSGIDMTSNDKGCVAVGVAIAYFTQKKHRVSIPLNDTQAYDLIVDINGALKKVQVKYAGHKDHENYAVRLTTYGRKNKEGVPYKKYLKHGDMQLLFVLTELGDRYLIPSAVITTEYVWLGDKYEEYKL